MELPTPESLVGRTLGGQYRVLSVLASGGMGTVYVAEQTNLHRKVAVKVLRPDAQKDESLVARFRAEAEIISALRHPNTLKLFDYGATEDGVLYLVTALLEGEPLSAALKRGPLGQERVVHILREVLASLAEAHAMGVVHRDLKPGNIFLERLGKQELVKVLDFGIAKASPAVRIEEGGEARELPAEHAPETQAGTLVGTPAYISPEQAYARPVDARSDIYSLGVVAYQALTGRLPFEGEAVAQLAAHAMDPPPAFRTLIPVPEVDERLELLVLQMLQKRPEDRPQSAEGLLEQLDALGLEFKVSSSSLSAPPPPAPTGAGRAWLIATLLIALVIGGFGLWTSQQPRLTSLSAPPPPQEPPPALKPTQPEVDSATVAPAPRIRPAAPRPPEELFDEPADSRWRFNARLGRGWRQPEALRPIVLKLRKQLEACYETTSAAGLVRVRVEVGESGVALQTSRHRRALKTCMQLSMDELIQWPAHARRRATIVLELRRQL